MSPHGVAATARSSQTRALQAKSVLARSALVRSLLAGSVLAGLSLTVAAPALADPAPIEYRVNGSAWSASPPALFDSNVRPVPGAELTSTLEIRSARPGTTIIAVYLDGIRFGGEPLRDATTLMAAGTALDLSGDACQAVGEQRVLLRGESMSIPVSFALDPALESMQSTELGFSLLVAASDTGPTSLSNGCPVDPAIVRAFPADDAPDETDTPPRKGADTPPKDTDAPPRGTDTNTSLSHTGATGAPPWLVGAIAVGAAIAGAAALAARGLPHSPARSAAHPAHRTRTRDATRRRRP